jgi:D-3-phosphoglycerate dehydrogenase
VVNSVLKTVDQTTVSNNNVGFNDEKPTILVSEKLGEAGLQVLRQLGNVECAYDLSPEDLCKKISSCDALIVRSGTKVTRQVFEAGKGKLKVVGRAGVGIDNVDLQAATEFGCLVVNAPTANTIAAAEHGIALLAAMARNVSQADASLKAGTNNTDSLLSSSIHAFTNCLISIVWMRGIYDQRESRFIH